MANSSSRDDGEQDEVKGQEEDTLTPPASTSPSSTGVGGASASSVIWSKGAPNFQTGSTLRQVSVEWIPFIHVHTVYILCTTCI